MMLIFIESGGFTSEGINIDAKIRRNASDLEDLFIVHVSGMVSFAKALKVADRILADLDYAMMKNNRCSSF